MKILIALTLTLLFFSQLENVHGDDLMDRLRAQIAIRSYYMDYIRNYFQNENENLERNEFASMLKNYVHKRIENEKSNNFWRLRQG
jgi:hypothetical protein